MKTNKSLAALSQRSTAHRTVVLRALLAAALVLPLVAIAPATLQAGAAPKAQPLLLQMAAEHPGTQVGVIVQKNVHDKSVEQSVARMGGTATRDLHIINAFAAQMPTSKVRDLAQDPSVRWISLDAPVTKADDGCSNCVDTTNLQTAYVQSVHADRVWNSAPYLQGQGVTVAVVDSGMNANHRDFRAPNGTNRVLAQVKFSLLTLTPTDLYGHGTHVAGIIGGDGDMSADGYIGIAPRVNLVNVKIGDDLGLVNTSDVVQGLQWVFDHRTTYNIKVVNLSLTESAAESYDTNPIDAAAEILWFNRVVVVVAGGNNGNGGSVPIYPPANDPFVITVGAANDRGTVSTSDDTMAPFSAYGTTESGFAKPDLVAPGVNIVSTLASRLERMALLHQDHVVNNYYFRLSGTSMSSPVVAGAAALLLQSNPNLNPDQVKYRLKATARPFGPGAGAGYLDVYAAVNGRTTSRANSGIVASHLLWAGGQPITWGSVNWGCVNWGSVNWGSVNWGSTDWNTVDFWGLLP